MNPTNNMDLTSLLKAVEQASQKSDRFLFIAALVILLMFGAYALRLLFTELKTTRIAYEKSLHDIIKEQTLQQKLAIESQVKNTVALDLNTHALSLFTTKIDTSK